MIDLTGALFSRETSWAMFKEAYPNYVSEDQRYMALIHQLLPPNARVLDAGCGWTLPYARQLADRAAEVIGVDLGLDENRDLPPNVRAVPGDLENLPFNDRYFDLVMSRSVLEHLERPERVMREIGRVLKPGGHFVFLIPNAWDYVSIISRLVPNRVHGFIIEKLMGRDPRDTFPTYYRANTLPALRSLAQGAGMELVEARFLSQYPAYLMFSPIAFRLGIAYERLVRTRPTLAPLRSWILGAARKQDRK